MNRERREEKRSTCIIEGVGETIAATGLDAELEIGALPHLEQVPYPGRRRLRQSQSLPPRRRPYPFRRGRQERGHPPPPIRSMGLAVADGEGEIGKLGRQAGEIGMSTEEEEMDSRRFQPVWIGRFYLESATMFENYLYKVLLMRVQKFSIYNQLSLRINEQ